MATRLNYAVASIAVTLLLTISQKASAQPSIAAEDINNQFDVVVGSEKLSFTVLRDAYRQEQWYYAPNMIRLSERTVGSATVPEFTLLRYQFRNPDNAQQILEGGLLQFATVFSAPPGAVDAIIAKLSQQSGTPAAQIRLAPLPMRDVKINIYTPGQDGGVSKLVTSSSADVIGNVGPVFATQKMPFSVALTSIGVDVYDALTTQGGTGVIVASTFSFSGLTKPARFKITVNWDKTYQYYSSDQKIRAAASIANFSGSYSSDRTYVMQQLHQHDCIKFEAFPNETIGLEKMMELAGPYLDRINKELLEKVEPLTQMQPAQAQEPPAAWYQRSTKSLLGIVLTSSTSSGGGGYSVAVKDITSVRTGSSTFSFEFATPVMVNTGFGGFIGIGGYPEPVRKAAVTFVPMGPWKKAFLTLPSVNDQNGVASISLEASLSIGGADYMTQTATWTPQNRWKSIDGGEVTLVNFPLSALPAPLSNTSIEHISIKTTTKITHDNRVITVSKVLPAFDGQKAITTPLDSRDIEWVEVDASGLPWKTLGAGDLVKIDVKLTSAGESVQKSIRPLLVNGAYLPPTPVYWLYNKDDAAIQPVVRFFKAGTNTPVEWSGNNINLRSPKQTMSIFLGAVE